MQEIRLIIQFWIIVFLEAWKSLRSEMDWFGIPFYFGALVMLVNAFLLKKSFSFLIDNIRKKVENGWMIAAILIYAGFVFKTTYILFNKEKEARLEAEAALAQKSIPNAAQREIIRKKEVREHLGEFLKRAIRFREQMWASREPSIELVSAIREWHTTVDAYLLKKLDSSYVNEFNSIQVENMNSFMLTDKIKYLEKFIDENK